MSEPEPKAHDALFRHVFSDPEHAAGELKLVLPEPLVARIDWSTLHTVDASVVDRELREVASDLTFCANVDGREAWIYVLVEHQSRVDPLMGFRLLRYMVRLWQRWLDSHPGATRLPAILPLVVHHSAGAWTAPVAFHDLVDLSPEALVAAGEHLPSFRYLVDDLAVQAVDDLGARAMTALGRVALICLARARHSPDLLGELERAAALLKDVLGAPHGVGAFAAIVSYILHVTEVAPEVLHDFAQHLGPAAVEAYMTGAQQLTEQVRKEALEEGRMAAARIFLRLAQTKFGALSSEQEAQIQQASTEQLNAWAERVLEASSLDELLGA